MQGLGLALTVVSGLLLLGDAWEELGKRDLGELYQTLFSVAVPVGLAALLVSAEVDRFASLWGTYALWKLVLAVAVFLAFPVLAWLFHRQRKGYHRWLGYSLSGLVFASLLSLVIYDWITFGTGMPPTEETRNALPWLSRHPSPAIHHLFANATYLLAWEGLWVSALWGRGISTRIGKLLQRPRAVLALNAVLFLFGILLQVWGGSC